FIGSDYFYEALEHILTNIGTQYFINFKDQILSE
ncbi:MAG: hypothetical protein ACI9LN_003783, partial [Saprospiraceae bacterium]